jgi:voltage-gated potassium channel
MSARANHPESGYVADGRTDDRVSEGDSMTSIRTRIYRQLEPRAWPGLGLSPVNRALAVLILAATALAIADTEPLLERRFGAWFMAAELLFALVFAVEYALRIWTAPLAREGESAWKARLKFLISPAAILDLLAIAASLVVVGGSSAMLLRLARLGRILRLAKLGRMSRALEHLSEAVASRREELLLSLMAGFFLMVVAATALYLAEGAIQPDKFGSILRALWWSVATMTTIGYGDVFPVTPLGKLLAAITAIFSIGFIALPTGILASAFSDAVQRHKSRTDDET